MADPYDPKSSRYLGTSATHGFELTPELRDYFGGGTNALETGAIKNLWRGEDLMFGGLGEMQAPHGKDVSLIEDMQGKFHYVPKSASSLQDMYRDNLLKHNERVGGVGQLPGNYPTDVLKFSDPRFAWMDKSYDFPRFQWGGDQYRGASGSPGYSTEQFDQWRENATGRSQLDTPEGPSPIHDFMSNQSKFGVPDGKLDPNWYQELWQDHPIYTGMGHGIATWMATRGLGALARGPLPRVVRDMWRTRKARKVTDDINQLTKDKSPGWEDKVAELKKSPYLIESEKAAAARETVARRGPGQFAYDFMFGGGNQMKGATVTGGTPTITDPDVVPPLDGLDPTMGDPGMPTRPTPESPTSPTSPTTPLTSPDLKFDSYTSAAGSKWVAKYESFVGGSKTPFVQEVRDAWPLDSGAGNMLAETRLGNLETDFPDKARERINLMNDQHQLFSTVYEQLTDPAVFQAGKIVASGQEFTFEPGSIASADQMLKGLLEKFKIQASNFDAKLLGSAKYTGHEIHEEPNPLFSELTEIKGIHADSRGQGGPENRARYIGDVLRKTTYKAGDGIREGQIMGSLSKYQTIFKLNELYKAAWESIASLNSDPLIAREQALRILDEFFPYDAHLPANHADLNPDSNIHKSVAGGYKGTDPYSMLDYMARNSLSSFYDPNAEVEYQGKRFTASELFQIVDDVKKMAESATSGHSGRWQDVLPTNPHAISDEIIRLLYPGTDTAARGKAAAMRANARKLPLRTPAKFIFRPPVIAP